MKLHLKRLYHETVRQLEKHKTEIEIALAIVAIVGLSPEDVEVSLARAAIEDMYKEIIEITGKHIKTINDILDSDVEE